MRSYSLQETAQFVYQLSMKETNHEKHLKLGNLTLSPEEWTRVRYLTNLLDVSYPIFCSISVSNNPYKHANIAQQAFSAAARPTLHNALPAIEKLYSAWEKASEKPRYAQFKPALNAAMEKLNEYYERTADSDAHIIAMGILFHSLCVIWFNQQDLALDPRHKFGHFKKHWNTEQQREVDKVVQAKVIPNWLLYMRFMLTI